MISRRNIPCINSIPVNTDLLRYYAPKLDIGAFRNMYFVCPKCDATSTIYCDKCNLFGVSMRGYNYMTSFTLDAIKGCIACICDAIFTMISGTKYTYLLVRNPDHHISDKHEGFCFFPNAFFAAEQDIDAGYSSVGIFDWDFHHCNGTQKLVERTDKNICVASIHGYGRRIYPFSGKRSENTNKVLNIPINLDCISREIVTSQVYFKFFVTEVIEFFKRSNIDFIIISNGLDAHKNDSLVGMNVGTDFYVNTSLVLKELGIPIMYILECGYTDTVISEVTEQIYDAMSS